MPFIHETFSANGTTILGAVAGPHAVINMIVNDQILSMAVNAGGTGYVVGETFELNAGVAVARPGGAAGTMVARGIVTAESAGVVTAVKIISAGAYSTLPGVTGIATANASAGGNDDLTVDLTTQAARWTEDRGLGLLGTDYVDDETDFEFLATSVKASNAPTCGMETDTTGIEGGVRLQTATGFNSGSTFDGQPGGITSSPPFVSVANSGTIDVYVSVTERRVNFVFRNGNNVQHGSFGLFIPFTDTDANYPFPGFCAGQSTHINAMTEAYNNNGFSNASNAGLVHPGDFDSLIGAYQYRDNLSPAWFGYSFTNNAGSDPQEAQLWPHQGAHGAYSLTYAPQVNGQSTDTNDNESGTNSSVLGEHSEGWFADSNGGGEGVPGVAALGQGSRLTFTVQPHIIKNRPSDVQIIGIIDGWEACHGIGLTAFEELVTDGETKRFLIFPDTNSTELKFWTAMEKI